MRVSLGRYYPGASPLHRMDPRVKLVLLLVYFVSVIVAPLPWGLVLALALLAGTVTVCGVPLAALARTCRPLLFFVVISILSGLFLEPSGDVLVQVGGWELTTGALTSGVVLGVRVFALMLAGVVYALVTSPIAITDGLERLLSPFARFGLPAHDIAMTFSIAIRFVPILSDELRDIIAAQQARGASFGEGSPATRARFFVSLATPLFAGALRHAEALARAMESRCYGAGGKRTHFHELRIARLDLLAMAVFAVYLAALAAVGLLGI